MKIKLAQAPHIPDPLLRAFHEAALGIRDPFNLMVDSVTSALGHDLHWLCTAPASRNPLVSPLLFRCALLATIKDNWGGQLDGLTEITTNSPALAEILLGMHAIKAHGVRVTTVADTPAKTAHKALPDILWQQVRQWLAVRTKGPRPQLPNLPLTLVDTFWNAKHKDQDHYYGNLSELLTPQETETVFFVPQITGLGPPGNYLASATALERVPRNMLTKERFLTLSDYWFAMRFTRRALRLKAPETYFMGLRVEGLIQEELDRAVNVRSIFGAALNLRFARRLKRAGIQVKHVVNWFENQELDRCFNRGFREHYPDTPITGYVGFLPYALYTGATPTPAEAKAEVLPHNVATMSPAGDRSVTHYLEKLPTRRAPSFRYAHIFESRERTPSPGAFTVLAIFPLSLPLSRLVYDRLANALHIFPQGTRFLLKPHPSFTPAKFVSKLSSEMPPGFEVASQGIPDLLAIGNLAVSSLSSAGLEAMIMGLPLIDVAHNGGITNSPVPEGVPDTIHRLCFTQEEFNRAVRDLAVPGRLPDLESSRRILDSCFTEPTRERALDLLGTPQAT